MPLQRRGGPMLSLVCVYAQCRQDAAQPDAPAVDADDAAETVRPRSEIELQESSSEN